MKKAKQGQVLRKRLNFYKINYDFHYPYNLLVDGNFIYYCLQTQYPFSQKLQKYLKGPVFYYTTPCILSELRGLGEQFFSTFLEAKKFQTIKCKHEKCVESDECIQHIVKKFQQKKFLVATQDKSLKEKFKSLELEFPVPIFYFSGQKLTIDKPELKTNINAALIQNPHEQKMIQKVQKEMRDQEFQKKKKEFEKEKNVLGLKTKKKAQGPNPLSVKKRIQKVPQNNAQQMDQKAKKRIHKRSKKHISN